MPRTAAGLSAYPSAFDSQAAQGTAHVPGTHGWTPLRQAMDRFLTRRHRFSSERWMQLLAPSLDALSAEFRSGGSDLTRLLSQDFRGAVLSPEREATIRDDSHFKVRRAVFSEAANAAVNRADFIHALDGFLAPHQPLALADFACLAIFGAPPENPSRIQTRVRFELAGALALDSPRSGVPRWQATGEWQIEWAEHGGWKVAAWRPLEMVTVEGPGRAFADVTESAFGADPSYRRHLLRDTNYWRAVLDKASGVDIFGNSGVSVGDADGDGRDEIYLCQPQGLPNRLYRQRRSGVFEDVAREAGLDLLDNTSMALFADVLNRGRQDLILITETSPLLFLNDGRGRFTWKRDAFPPPASQSTLTGAAMADYDRDGFLDIYVCSYAYLQGEGDSRLPSPYYDAQNGPPNYLFHNQGDGSFSDVTRSSGLDRGNNRFSFACRWNDVDDDGWPDLAVVNDFGRNNFYRNLHNGKFQEVTDALSGYGSGMSASFANLDPGRAAADLYVSNMWVPAGERVTADPDFRRRFADLPPDCVRQFAMGNALYRNEAAVRTPPPQGLPADGGPSDAPPFRMALGASGAGHGRWAWASDAFDATNSGTLDLHVVNGYLSSPEPGRPPLDAYLWEEILALTSRTRTAGSDYRAAWTAIYEFAHQGHPWNGNERNVFFLNVGGGRFEDASAVTGLDSRDDGRAFAVFDYDGDGDADLVLHNRTGAQLRLLRNDLAGANQSLALRLRATRGNRDAIGARVEVETSDGKQVRELACGSGFLSQHSKELVVGLGKNPVALKVRVRWPSGARSELSDLEAGFRYFLREGEPTPTKEAFTKPAVAAVNVASSSPAATSAPVVDSIPARFSTALVEPLSVTLPGPLREARLLWLWNPAHSGPGLETLLAVEHSVPSKLVLWSSGAPSLPASLAGVPWQADAQFRQHWTTLLAYLFDYRREPVFPTGLLFSQSNSELRTPNRELVKIYWGGAEAAEILRDARDHVPPGLAALPFPGRTLLAGFRRDTRALGAALVTAGLYAEAELYVAEAVKANPQDADALYDLALAREEIGKLVQGIASARAALALRPQFPEAENLLGVLLSRTGRLDEARTLFQQATAAVPDFVEAWNNLGNALLSANDLVEAQKALERALALAPDFSNALNNLGIVKARQGDFAGAEALFRRVLGVEPDNEQAGNNLAVLYAKQGKTEAAEKILRSVLEQNPGAASVLLNLARLEISLHNPSQARELLTQWLARHPDDQAARALLNQIR